jgi:GNAT superfamily N-acetyltransferase
MDHPPRSIGNGDCTNSACGMDKPLYLARRTLQLYTLSLDRKLKPPSTSFALDIIEADTTVNLEHAHEHRIRRRLSRGCRLFLALHKKDTVGYIFTAMSQCFIEEVEQTLHIMPYECYFFDAYTYPAFRGHGIYPALLIYAARSFQALAYRHALIFALGTNRSSVQGIKKTGFTCYGTVTYYEIFGHRFWRYRTNNGRVKSYFDGRA